MNGFYNTYPYHYEENATQFPQYGKTIMSLPDASLITIEMNGCLLDLTHMNHIKTSRSYDISKGITKEQHYMKIQIKIFIKWMKLFMPIFTI